MSVIKSFSFGCLVCFIILFCLSTRVPAQTSKPESAQGDRDQTLRQLLIEVHELRLTIQRSTASNARFQMLIERVRIQQVHVDALSWQLESVHSQDAEMRSAKPQMEQQIKDIEDLLDRTPEPNAHAEVESHVKAVKRDLARLTLRQEQLRDRETAMNAELQTAQSKLNELNSQLDVLMNEMK